MTLYNTNGFLVLFSAYILACVKAELVVNVKDKGGDVIKEKIEANTSADTVTLEFLGKDGIFVTQFIDFKSEAQVFRLHIPWEEERGIVEPNPMVLCFVSRFGKNEFISSDAMSKLRQKNPTAIRTPEEDRSPETHILDLQVDLGMAHVLSPHIYNMCRDAVDAIYSQESDVKILSRTLGKDFNTMLSTMKKISPLTYPRCKDTTDNTKQCICHVEVCIGWYPCGLKYCRGRDSTGKVVNYRCGIKTCKRCLKFEHVTKQKKYCLWDEV